MTDPVPAARGRVAMAFLVAFCASVSAMSLIALAYQSTFRLPNGELFRDTPLAWHHLVGHLLRGVGLAAVGVAILRCRRATDATQAAAAAGTFWNRLALFVAVMLAYVALFWWLTIREAAAFVAEGADRPQW